MFRSVLVVASQKGLINGCESVGKKEWIKLLILNQDSIAVAYPALEWTKARTMAAILETNFPFIFTIFLLDYWMRPFRLKENWVWYIHHNIFVFLYVIRQIGGRCGEKARQQNLIGKRLIIKWIFIHS